VAISSSISRRKAGFEQFHIAASVVLSARFAASNRCLWCVFRNCSRSWP
jgi:hypothetical protein